MSVPPTMVVSFVWHTHASSVSDTERIPGLSRHGRHDTVRVTVRLAGLVDVVAISLAERARATVEGVADAVDAPFIVDDDLKERELADLLIKDFDEAVEHLRANSNALYPGGESHAEAQAHGIAAVNRLVEAYPDHYVVVGTYVTLMALVFNAYDSRYGHELWMGLMTPNTYEVTFVNGEAFSIARMWTLEEAAREGDADRDSTER